MAEKPKLYNQYKVRKGYVWVGRDGKGTEQVLVTPNDPAFKGQKYKLEAIVSSGEFNAAPVAAAPAATPPAAPVQSPDNRQINAGDLTSREG